MDISNRIKRKIFFSFILCLVIDLLLHRIGPEIIYSNPSIINQNKGLFFPLIILGILMTWLIPLILYLKKGKFLTGNPRYGALKVGAAYSLITFVSMHEMSILHDSPIWVETYTGLIDGGALILLFWLISQIIKMDSNNLKTGVPGKNLVLNGVIFIGLFFAVRYFSYYVLKVDANFTKKILETFLVTVLEGVSFMVLFLTTRGIFTKYRPLKGSLYFSLVIFGIFFLIYALIEPIFAQASIGIILLRVLLDIITVFSASFISLKFIKDRLK